MSGHGLELQHCIAQTLQIKKFENQINQTRLYIKAYVNDDGNGREFFSPWKQ